MSNLYSSDGDIKFYNYISPSFYSGVPVGSVDKNIFQFLSEHAFDSVDVAVSGIDYTFYKFPQVGGTPTEKEPLTGTTSSSTNARGVYRNANQELRSIAIGSTSKYIGMSQSSFSTGTSGSRNENPTVKFGTSVISTALDGATSVILFITKSPTSMIFGECWLSGGIYEPLTNPSRFSVVITGWMHDSIFFNSSNPIASYYSMVFSTNSNNLFNSSFDGRRLNTTANNVSASLEHRYYDITCQAGTGTYTGQDVFLTDIILYDRYNPGIQIGKIDNRIACLGRGNLQQGRIYRTINPFGRTGTEYWLCLGSYTPDETKWQKTTSDLLLPASLFRTWDINNRDFILQRIQLRPDLP